jgi:hypothetical protein
VNTPALPSAMITSVIPPLVPAIGCTRCVVSTTPPSSVVKAAT